MNLRFGLDLNTIMKINSGLVWDRFVIHTFMSLNSINRRVSFFYQKIIEAKSLNVNPFNPKVELDLINRYWLLNYLDKFKFI